MRNTAGFIAVAVAGLLVGCGGTGTVSASDVEEQAQTQFAEQFPVESVECDEDLPGEVGATITCVLVSEGTSFEMTATATELEGDTVNLEFELTDELSDS